MTKRTLKKSLKFFVVILSLLAFLFILLIIWLTATEFIPAPVESAQLYSAGSDVLSGDTLRIVTWNTGYAALGKEADSFFDGGVDIRAKSPESVSKNLSGILDTLKELEADIYFLQEVDSDSSRSYFIDQRSFYISELGMSGSYALNFSCRYVPYPIPPLGRVNSGLLTLSRWNIEQSDRISLPCPFSWPVRTANLKRCLNVCYLPIEGSDSYLIAVNLHLEAYDDGSGKKEQTKFLLDFLKEAYAQGNYVIAGGDFNQIFPQSSEYFPITDTGYWTPGELNVQDLPDGWQFICDADGATCRLLNTPYVKGSGENHLYVIDGFILSPNLECIQVETIDKGFAFSDHQPVFLELKLLNQ